MAKGTENRGEMEMEGELWTAVDRYLGDLLVSADPALEASLAASAAAGLPAINVSPVQGKLLHLLARAIGARNVLEIGTLGGYSTIWLARALPDGGRLISLEADAKHAEVAGANIARADLENKVEVRLGLALDLLPGLAAERKEPFDFVFIDADKPNNAAYFDWALKLSRPGSIIVVDNVVRDGDVIDAVSDSPTVQGVRRFLERLAAEPRVSATAIQTVGTKGYDAFVVCLSPWTPRRIGTAYGTAHILFMPLAKPGDSGQTRITGQRAFHQRWERPEAIRPHGSVTGAGECHASVLPCSPYPGSAHPAGACPVDRCPHARKRGATCCRVANCSTVAAASSPTPCRPPRGLHEHRNRTRPDSRRAGRRDRRRCFRALVGTTYRRWAGSTRVVSPATR